MISVKLRVRLVEGVEVLALLLGHVPHARHMRPGKQQVLRIHETGFHEPLGLLRAPTRIRFVDQTALVVQKVVEITPGSRELLPEVLATDLQELGTDEVGHAENLAEDVNQALLAIEAQQHARGATDSGFVHQQLHIGRHGPRIRQIHIGRAASRPSP